VTDLEPGTQEIMVVPSNARHQELDTAGRLLIEIADSPAAAAPPSTDGTPLVVAGVAFVVSRRK